ncbi:MAG: SPOR domain-containing protein [Gammaproteobacteria bacterium]
MERGLKERLVGAVVLVMLGVIFIPMLLDDSPSESTRITETNIPEPPSDEFSSRIIPAVPEPVTPADPVTAPAASEPVEAEPPAVEAAPPAQVADDTPAAEPAKPAAKSKPELTAELPKAADGSGQLGAWVVQLASLSNADNAEKLSKKMQAAGFQAFVEPIQSGDKTMYRVRVGPEVLRADAERIRDQIKAKQDIEGFVVSYP